MLRRSAAQPLVTTALKAENVAQGQRQARCRSRSSPAGWAAVSADRVGAAIEAEARRIERETACSALAHRMATSAWRRIYFALGVPTTALAAVAGASALAHYRIAAAVFALGAAVASALMTFTNPAGQVAEHRKASSRYRAVENRARVLWQVTCADETDSESLRQELDELIEEWSKTSEGSPPLFESLHRRARRRAEEGR
ncbi:MAG: SLATT domain-containing protein [Actinobacteria bacterium]|nr:MAG: SLATT domain-containing protein [Actinomycetota bacterium]